MTTQIKIIVGALILALSCGGTWYFTKTHYIDKYEAQIAKTQSEHDKKVTDLTNDKLDLERQLGETRNEIEVEHNKAIEDLNARIESLRRDNVRLRDPGASKTSCSAPRDPGATGGSSDGDEATGLLSRQATEFLWDFAGEADRTLEELRTCKRWVDEVRRINEEHRLKQEGK